MRTSRTTSASVRHAAQDGSRKIVIRSGIAMSPYGLVTLGQRDALVQAEQVRAPAVLDHDHDVVHQRAISSGMPSSASPPAPRTAPAETSSTLLTYPARRWTLRVLLAGLDPAQRSAVTADENPLCILAGAGSGKTRVLTRRIAHRAETGDADPRHVLALTFTRKAAGELRTRLGRARACGTGPRPARSTPSPGPALRAAGPPRAGRRPSLLDRKARLVGPHPRAHGPR